MKKIVLFDTSVGTMNQGDYIIMQSVIDNTEEIRKGNFVIHFPTHTPSFTAYQQFKQNLRYDFVRHADIKFICGTNIITRRMLFPWTFWNVNIFNCNCYKGAICIGVGSSGFNGQNSIGRGYTSLLYSKILSKDYVHSTRDEHTKLLLESIGLKAINTGCPTMWQLTQDHCARIPTIKADAVIFTLNAGLINIETDQRLIDLLVSSYKRVYYWPQGLKDMQYLNSLKNIENILILSADIYDYDRLLNTVENIEYVGTRLHAGIFAMQHKKRSFIIAIDNRATDISKTYNINVFDRSDIHTLELAIESQFETKVEIDMESIKEWKRQF